MLRNTFLLAAFFALFSAKGQVSWDDWGGGTSPYTLSSGTDNLGNVHAQVDMVHISIIPISIGQYTFFTGSFPVTNATTSFFSTGDIVMFVQMDKGSGTRNYDLARVTSKVTGTSIDVEFAQQSRNNVSLSTTDLHVNWANTSALVQVVKIYCFSDFTISGGTVTCDPWDGHSGGILAIDVEGTLTLDGGAINVDGKGYTGAVTVSGGGNGEYTDIDKGAGATTQAGAGGNATNTGFTALEGSHGNKLGDAQSPSCPDVHSHDGGNGGSGTMVMEGGYGDAENGNAGASGESHGSYADPANLYINLGAGGASGASGRGSSSGGGGGGGGAGYYYKGDTYTAYDPTDGTDGNTADAGHGGDGGAGGNGGGFIYLRALNITGTVSGLFYATELSANGNDGEAGGDATGNPGAGGDGGKGGDGYCDGTDIWASGGGGSAGYGGDGGDGGDAGDGGVPGGAFVIYNNNSFVLPPIHISTNDGRQNTYGGAGINGAGDGSFGADGTGQNVSCIQNGGNNCFIYIGKSRRQIKHRCDCNNAFLALGHAASCDETGYTCDFDPYNAYYSARWEAFGLEGHKYTTGTSTSTSSANSIDDKYICDMAHSASDPGLPCPFFINLCESLSGMYFGSAEIDGGNVQWGGSPAYYGGYYPSQTTPPFIVYDHKSTGESDHQVKLCGSECHHDGYNGGHGNGDVHPRGYYDLTTDANTGEGTYYGTNDISDPLGPVFVKSKNTGTDLPPLTLLPNPTKDLINLNYFTKENIQEYELSIMDAQGKEVTSLKFSSQKGHNSYALNTSAFANGTYMVKLKSNGIIQKANFVKQ